MERKNKECQKEKKTLKKINENIKGITMVTLVVTIIVLLILVEVAINLSIGKNGIFTRAEKSSTEYNKQEATEKMHLKITSVQVNTYTEKQRLPTLQELANEFSEDDEIAYVHLEAGKIASLAQIDIKNAKSIFTKLEKYPYEFEINSNLMLASINGVQLSNNEGEVPEGYVKPSGSMTIEENGTYDVTNFATAIVTGLYNKEQYDNRYNDGYTAGMSNNTCIIKEIDIVYTNQNNGWTYYELGFIPNFLFLKVQNNGQYWMALKSDTVGEGQKIYYSNYLSDSGVDSTGRLKFVDKGIQIQVTKSNDTNIRKSNFICNKINLWENGTVLFSQKLKLKATLKKMILFSIIYSNINKGDSK